MWEQIETADNPRGLFSMSIFNDDDTRSLLATMSAKSLSSVKVVRLSPFQEYEIKDVFCSSGSEAGGEQSPYAMIGDIKLDAPGEKLVIVN